MKYIIIRGMNEFKEVVEQPLIFSNNLMHSHVELRSRRILDYSDCVGAGFVQIDKNGQFIAFGESESLRIKSRLEIDTKILNGSGMTNS